MHLRLQALTFLFKHGLTSSGRRGRFELNMALKLSGDFSQAILESLNKRERSLTMNDISSAAMPAGRAPVVTRERAAVAMMFLMNGFLVGAWAPKIPEFASRLSLSESALGLMILTFGLGSIIMMPVAGMQIARFGSARVTRVTAVLVVPTLLFLSLVNTIWAGALAIFLFGGLIGAMDVAMNANAVAVEKQMRRSIMSSCHAFWSLGGLIGASTGGILIAALGTFGHAAIATIAAAALVAIAWQMMLADKPHAEEAKEKIRLPMTPLPWLIGLVALFSMIPEGAVLDWGALYLRNELVLRCSFPALPMPPSR